MPITLEIDNDRQCATFAMAGPFDANEVLQSLERQRNEGAWSYAVLFDTRRMTDSPTLDQVKHLFSVTGQPGPASEMRGPLALLATDAALYSMACAYMALGGATRKIEVFRELADAERWLDQHLRSTR